MLSLYRQVTVDAARRAVAAWPAALAFPVYAIILLVATLAFARLGIISGFLIGLVMAACWSSYIELVSQAVAGSKIRIHWDDFRRTFLARFWDVTSVMFAFWIISFITTPLMKGPNALAAAGVIGFAMAFFFNVVPELLYQGHSRSFSLLMDSARFMFKFPVVWLLPNILFAAVGFGFVVLLRKIVPPGGLLILPIALVALHYVMIFRGILFRELVAGGGNTRLRAFQAKMRG